MGVWRGKKKNVGEEGVERGGRGGGAGGILIVKHLMRTPSKT